MDSININGYSIDWHKGEATKAQRIVTIEPKQLSLLKRLVQANGALVSYQRIALHTNKALLFAQWSPSNNHYRPSAIAHSAN